MLGYLEFAERDASGYELERCENGTISVRIEESAALIGRRFCDAFSRGAREDGISFVAASVKDIGDLPTVINYLRSCPHSAEPIRVPISYKPVGIFESESTFFAKFSTIVIEPIAISEHLSPSDFQDPYLKKLVLSCTTPDLRLVLEALCENIALIRLLSRKGDSIYAEIRGERLRREESKSYHDWKRNEDMSEEDEVFEEVSGYIGEAPEVVRRSLKVLSDLGLVKCEYGVYSVEFDLIAFEPLNVNTFLSIF